jgi:hypothetical protein
MRNPPFHPAAPRASRSASTSAQSAIRPRKSYSSNGVIDFRRWPSRTARLLEALRARA